MYVLFKFYFLLHIDYSLFHISPLVLSHVDNKDTSGKLMDEVEMTFFKSVITSFENARFGFGTKDMIGYSHLGVILHPSYSTENIAASRLAIIQNRK